MWAFGIVSDTSWVHSNVAHWNAQGNMYYYYGQGRLCSGYDTKDAPRYYSPLVDGATANPDDIITIKLDCSVEGSWTVTFYKNEKQVADIINIVSTEPYHIFISTKQAGVEYEIVNYQTE